MTETEQHLGHAVGELTALRPVLETDLPVLVELIGEMPGDFDDRPRPWTLQRLKQRYEDEENPGFWGETKHLYTIVRHTGEVVGLLQESLDKHQVIWFAMHIRRGLADRAVLGGDALKAYLALARRWHNAPRICTGLVAVDPQQREWVRAAGLEYEFTAADCLLYRGEPAGMEIYAWVADWVLANRAVDGRLSGGEPCM